MRLLEKFCYKSGVKNNKNKCLFSENLLSDLEKTVCGLKISGSTSGWKMTTPGDITTTSTTKVTKKYEYYGNEEVYIIFTQFSKLFISQ